MEQDELAKDKGRQGLCIHEVTGQRWKQSGAGKTTTLAETHKGRKSSYLKREGKPTEMCMHISGC